MAKIKVMVFYPGEDMVGHLMDVENNLESFQRIIGGNLSHATLRPGWGMWFDDDFRQRGLPLNETASALWHLAYPHHPDLIGGVALICGQDDEWTGKDQDLPRHVIDWMEALGKVVKVPDA